ncbi:hypothetical protein B0H16DRAFT_1742351 [Mycena metata]|uniref:Uncharacterized protein n=1 Tax=Mycena metata TaxID=1033252 RepID=A0AAD7H933_9AGAR|nr:hypothetical protein B0H16DRAFT_1742351 [Mycena metata]
MVCDAPIKAFAACSSTYARNPSVHSISASTRCLPPPLPDNTAAYHREPPPPRRTVCDAEDAARALAITHGFATAVFFISPFSATAFSPSRSSNFFPSKQR